MTTAAALTLICAIALFLRVVPPYHEVFRDGRVVFAGNDPWIHMRNADNIAAHWPWPNWFDPYRGAPNGDWTEAPLMDAVVAAIALVTRIPLDVAGAWFPAICGALVPIPLFFLVRRVFGTAEAAIAALLAAVFPGLLLQQSLLGNTDHHIVEVLLATTTLLFLSRRAALPAGITLGLYLLAWSRGAFLLLIIVGWAAVEITEQRKIAQLIAIAFGVALLVVAPVAVHLPTMRLDFPILMAGAVVIFVAERLPRRVAIGVLAVAFAGAVFGLGDLGAQLRRFVPSGGAATIGEVQPLLFVGGPFTIRPLWFELTTAAILAPIGFVISLRDRTPARTLLLVWSLVVTVATFAQVRFAYYMAIAAAIFAAVASVRLLWRGLGRTFAVIAIAAIVIYPNAALARLVARAPQPGPGDGWIEALDWMRTNTPEPCGSPGEYFARHSSASAAPRPRYTVMAWTDYGWWIARIARRVPFTNPTQARAAEAAKFYTATDERTAMAMLDSARYVIADRSMPMTIEGAGRIMSSQLEVMARWAGVNPSRFYELAFDHGQPLFLYYPDYYRTMAVRLFGYSGRAYTPANSTWAVAVDAKHNIVASRRFATYGEAEAFVAGNSGAWHIAGLHPLASCVPLEPLQHFRPVLVSKKHDVKVFAVR